MMFHFSRAKSAHPPGVPVPGVIEQPEPTALSGKQEGASPSLFQYWKTFDSENEKAPFWGLFCYFSRFSVVNVFGYYIQQSDSFRAMIEKLLHLFFISVPVEHLHRVDLPG